MTANTATIATEEEIAHFNSLPPNTRRVTERLKAAIGEIALTAVIRYRWEVLRPLIWHLLEIQFRDYDAEESVNRRGKESHTGPLPGVKDVDELCIKLKSMLEEFDSEPPFTVQRLCELALAPHKQYARLDKLALAVSKLLTVTTTQTPKPSYDLPPPPLVSSLQHVNELRRSEPTAVGPSTNANAGPSAMDTEGPMANGPMLEASLATTNAVLEAHTTTVEDQGLGVAADVDTGQQIERMQEG